MRRQTSLLLAAGLMLAACNSDTAEPETIDAGAEAASVATVSVEELADLVEAGKVLLVDVRTPGEFDETRMPGALNAPVETFDPAAIPQEAERETILYCRSGRRSGIAAEKLTEQWGTQVRHLDGGILAWRDKGMPTIN